MEALVLSIAAVLFIVALLRMPGLTEPALAWAHQVTGTIPGEEDEELPQTDRAPAQKWLPWTIAAVAAVRVVAFAALGA